MIGRCPAEATVATLKAGHRAATEGPGIRVIGREGGG